MARAALLAAVRAGGPAVQLDTTGWDNLFFEAEDTTASLADVTAYHVEVENIPNSYVAARAPQTPEDAA